MYCFPIGKAHATGVSGGVLIEINRVFLFEWMNASKIVKVFPCRLDKGNEGNYIQRNQF